LKKSVAPSNEEEREGDSDELPKRTYVRQPGYKGGRSIGQWGEKLLFSTNMEESSASDSQQQRGGWGREETTRNHQKKEETRVSLSGTGRKKP